MLVEDIMTVEVVTCPAGDTLADAARRMLQRGVGSVVVTRDGDPGGIVTETDALRAGASTERPFADIGVEAVASRPLVTTTRETTVRKAVDRMREEEVKKLPVVDGLELVGIVTRSDVATHYGEFVREAHALDRQRDRWEAKTDDPEKF